VSPRAMRQSLTRAGAASGRPAHDVLGREHPLARAEERVRWLRRQAAAVAAVLLASAPAVLVDVPHASAVAVASAAVEGILLLAATGASASVRHHARALVTGGSGTVPLAAVQRERSRLLAPRRRHALADAIDDLRDEASRPYACRPLRQPLYVPAFIRQLDDELAEIAETLRRRDPDITAVARIERLLGACDSPLYGRDLDELRHALRRITGLR
jgi:hypothetical protein